MKKLVIALLALCQFSVLVAQNGAYIEYKIISSKGNNGSMKINFSEYGSMMSFSMAVPQMPGGGMSMKSLSQKSAPDVMYMINDKDKTYSETKKSDVAREDTRTYTVKKLGEETVNGYKCVHALVTEGKETHEVWNTKDIPEFDKYTEEFKHNQRMGSAKRDQALRNAGCDGFPVKMVHKGNEREGDMTMELVKIEKKTFAKSDFEIPSGYKKTEGAAAGMKSQQDIMKMTPEEREKYIEEMKKNYGGGK